MIEIEEHEKSKVFLLCKKVHECPVLGQDHAFFVLSA